MIGHTPYSISYELRCLSYKRNPKYLHAVDFCLDELSSLLIAVRELLRIWVCVHMVKSKVTIAKNIEAFIRAIPRFGVGDIKPRT